MEELPEVELLNKDMGAYKLLLQSDNANRGPLWLAWHYLQVYATWGIRLPNTEAALKTKLGIPNPGQYLFFDSMLEAYQSIDSACSNFMEVVFPNMVDIGNGLYEFASEIHSDDGDIFNVIINSIEQGDFENAIRDIEYIQRLAGQNEDKATEVKEQLAKFSKNLTDAEGNLESVKELIESDEKTSKATIDKLTGGEDVDGSLLAVQKLLSTDQDEYDHNVIVAATSVTYAWIIPIGTVAAGVVAGVYGSKAVEALKDLEETENLLKAKSIELNIANTTHNVQSLALNGVTSALTNTNLAITQVTDVKNAWNSIYSTLGSIANKLSAFTTTDGETDETTVTSIRQISRFANRVTEAWEEIWPAIQELVEAPYIQVESGEKTVSELTAEVTAQASAAA